MRRGQSLSKRRWQICFRPRGGGGGRVSDKDRVPGSVPPFRVLERCHVGNQLHYSVLETLLSANVCERIETTNPVTPIEPRNRRSIRLSTVIFNFRFFLSNGFSPRSLLPWCRTSTVRSFMKIKFPSDFSYLLILASIDISDWYSW